MRRSGGVQLTLAALLAVGALAQAPAPRLDPEQFRARDSHQGVTIAAVPLPDTPEAEKIFGPRRGPTRVGVLPVEVVIANGRAELVSVALERIVLETDSERFVRIDPEEISWLLFPPPEEKKSSRRPAPLPPFPTSKKSDKNRMKREEAEAALRQAELRAGLAAAGGLARGYLYFDLRGKTIDLERARLYVPEVVGTTSGEALLFFEIEFKPYAQP